MGDNRQPTVGDLFCGAGGFSEGFRQAGFSIVWGVDNWEPAFETFRNNFPEAKVFKDDLLSFDFKKLESVDVLIGSPPCTHFSFANKDGNGAVGTGLALVKKFISAIESIEPRYWIMENVPNLKPIMERELGPSAIGKYFPDRVILNSADFGVPQTRRRLFSGKFPVSRVLSMQSKTRMPLRDVVFSLPPLQASTLQTLVRDPSYNLAIPASQLTDHTVNKNLDRTQIKICIRNKRHHRWAGPMRFPDSFELPCRTITATPISTSRQSIVIADQRGNQSVLRELSARECACVQGFPITFQFFGMYVGQRYALVGNAVPPPVARTFAEAIRAEFGIPFDSAPILFTPKEKSPPVLITKGKSGRQRFSLKRSFRGFVPDTLPFSRVDFDNLGHNPATHPVERCLHLVEWEAVLYLGYARNYVSFKLDLPTASRIATYVCLRTLGRADVAYRVASIAAKEFSVNVPDASTLQAVWTGRAHGSKNPEWILTRTAQICKEAVGQPDAAKLGVTADECASFLRGTRISGGKDSHKGRWMLRKINVYTASAALATSIAALFANRGVIWLEENWGARYVHDAAKPSEEAPLRRTGVSPNDVLSAFSVARRSLPKLSEPLVLAPVKRM